jgi:hypothetical protein
MGNAIMDSKQFIEIRRLIENEFSHAVTKHPKFCDLFINKQTDWARLERIIKRENDENTPPYYAENILLEEVAEAFNAYSSGELEHSLQEFAQCGAVVMRCMFYVMEMIDKNAKA